MAGRKRVAEIDTTKERVSSKSFKQADNITLVPTSVVAKGQPVERSRRSSTEPFVEARPPPKIGAQGMKAIEKPNA